MTTRIEIHVRGTPHGRPRPVPVAMMGRRGKYVGRMVHPRGRAAGKKYEKAWARANAWDKAVQDACIGMAPAEPWTGPISLEITAFFERPQRLMARKHPDGPILHDVKPDRDNIDKAVMDSLKRAGMFTDDSQVCDGAVRKRYAARGCAPGVVIIAERMLIPTGVSP